MASKMRKTKENEVKDWKREHYNNYIVNLGILPVSFPF